MAGDAGIEYDIEAIYAARLNSKTESSTHRNNWRSDIVGGAGVEYDLEGVCAPGFQGTKGGKHIT